MSMPFPAPLPHGPITRVADGVYAVRGTYAMGPIMRIGRTMTILQQGDELVVMNAIRLSPEGEEELSKLGTVSHLVKLSDSHHVDERYYADRFRPQVWTLEGANLRDLSTTRRLGPDSPILGSTVIELTGTSGWRECVLLTESGGGTLVSCDALQNHADTEGSSFFARVMTPLMGFKGGVIVAGMWRRSQKLHGAEVAVTFAPVLEHSFENLVTGHGPAVVGGAADLVRGAVTRATGILAA
jgi:hypothetical protein